MLISPLYKSSLDFKNAYFCCWNQNILGAWPTFGGPVPPPGPNVEPRPCILAFNDVFWITNACYTSSSYVFTVSHSQHRDKILHRDDDGIIFSRPQIARRDVTNCRFQQSALSFAGFLCSSRVFLFLLCCRCSGLFMRVYILYITPRGVPSSRRSQVDVRCKRLVELCFCC